MTTRSRKAYTEDGVGLVKQAVDGRFGTDYLIEGEHFSGWYRAAEVELEIDREDPQGLAVGIEGSWETRSASRVVHLGYDDGSVIDDDLEMTYEGETDDAWDWFQSEYPSSHRTSMRIFSDWSDVRRKATRLRSDGRVSVVTSRPEYIRGRVAGDSDVYDVEIVRDFGDARKVSSWSCSCPWGHWAFKREHTYIGRQCSHALAMYYEMQSRDYKKSYVEEPVVRTAARNYSFEQQQALIDEVGFARQFGALNLEGAYEDIDENLI